MGVVASLPSPISVPSENITSDTQNTIPVLNQQTLPSNDECTNDIMSVVYEIISNDKPKAKINYDVTIKNDIDKKKATRRSCYKSKPYTMVSYGPISVRVRQRHTPTLKSGRRSKFLSLEGEAARKRELSRAKNRRTARKLKEKRSHIESQLANEIQALEAIEKDLLQKIDNLESYKQFLEERCQQQIFIKTETIQTSQAEYHSRRIQNDIPTHYDFIHAQIEPHFSPPDWQLFFSI